MIVDTLKKRFDDMLPLMKEKFGSLTENILYRAEKLENSKDINFEELERIMRESDKILKVDKQMKNLFSQM